MERTGDKNVGCGTNCENADADGSLCGFKDVDDLSQVAFLSTV